MSELTAKPWYKSMGVMSSLFIVLGSVAHLVGFDLGDPSLNAEAVAALVAGIGAFIGRVRAFEKIKK